MLAKACTMAGTGGMGRVQKVMTQPIVRAECIPCLRSAFQPARIACTGRKQDSCAVFMHMCMHGCSWHLPFALPHAGERALPCPVHSHESSSLSLLVPAPLFPRTVRCNTMHTTFPRLRTIPHLLALLCAIFRALRHRVALQRRFDRSRILRLAFAEPDLPLSAEQDSSHVNKSIAVHD